MMWFSLLVLIPLAAVVATAAAEGWDGFWRRHHQRADRGRHPADRDGGVRRDARQHRDGHDDRVGPGPGPVPGQGPARASSSTSRSRCRRSSPAWCCSRCTAPTARWASHFANTEVVGLPGVPVRHAALHRADGAAGARGARPRGRGGGRVARRQPVHDVPADHPAERCVPAIAAGAALSFARAVSEYGSLVLLSGNLPFETEVTSVRILSAHRERQPGDGRGRSPRVLLADLAARDRRPRHRPAEGGAPWLSDTAHRQDAR